MKKKNRINKRIQREKINEKFYKCIKELNRPYQSKSVVIKDEHGRSITEQKEILNRWKQYFESLLKTEIETMEIKKNWRLPGGIQDKQIYDSHIHTLRQIMEKGYEY